MEPFDDFEESGGCTCLLLEELTELESNSLRIRVVEAIESRVPEPIEVAGHSMGEGFPVRTTADSAKFELVWHSYVLYQLTNESFAEAQRPSEGRVAESVATFDSSSFLEFIARSARASNEFAGYQIICSDHIIDVVSAQRPDGHRIGKRRKVN
jgi:hypothetical protein